MTDLNGDVNDDGHGHHFKSTHVSHTAVRWFFAHIWALHAAPGPFEYRSQAL